MWIPYTNDITPRIKSKALAIGWMLEESYGELKTGHIVSKDDLDLLPSNVAVKGIPITVGSEVRTPVTQEVGTIVDIQGAGATRIATVEIGDDVISCKIPEFDQNKKSKGANYIGDLIHWQIWAGEINDFDEIEDEDDKEIDELLKLLL